MRLVDCRQLPSLLKVNERIEVSNAE